MTLDLGNHAHAHAHAHAEREKQRERSREREAEREKQREREAERERSLGTACRERQHLQALRRRGDGISELLRPWTHSGFQHTRTICYLGG